MKTANVPLEKILADPFAEELTSVLAHGVDRGLLTEMAGPSIGATGK